jgi:hypothetical protein
MVAGSDVSCGSGEVVGFLLHIKSWAKGSADELDMKYGLKLWVKDGSRVLA